MGQDRDVEGSLVCESWSSGEASEGELDDDDGSSEVSGLSQYDDDLYTVDQINAYLDESKGKAVPLDLVYEVCDESRLKVLVFFNKISSVFKSV